MGADLRQGIGTHGVDRCLDSCRKQALGAPQAHFFYAGRYADMLTARFCHSQILGLRVGHGTVLLTDREPSVSGFKASRLANT